MAVASAMPLIQGGVPPSKREAVLPGDELARALHGEALHLVEQPAQAGPVAARLAALAGAVHVVGLLEGREWVQLEALAGEVDVDDLAALEADLVARRRERQRAPVAPVALEAGEGRGHARRAEHVAERQRLDRVDHVAELLAAGAAQVAVGADRPHVPGPPAPVGARRDPLRAQAALERRGRRRAGRRGAWWAGGRRTRSRPRAQEAASRTTSAARSGRSRASRGCRRRRSPDPRGPAPPRARRRPPRGRGSGWA